MSIKLEARQRLTAAKAPAKAALAFLTEIGFKGLSLKATQEDMIKFWYKGYDNKVLTKHLGKPTSVDKSIRYKFGKAGIVAIWPNNMTVVMKNTGGSGLVVPTKPTLVPDAKVEPEVPVEPTTPPDSHQSPNTPGSTENDNAKVPVTHITPALEARYASIQGLKAPTAQMLFLKALWAFLNTAKFGGRLEAPNFRLLKDMGAQAMSLRGRWTASKRLLEVSPRLYNASQNFFVEVVLHEMCHQAVSEIDGTREAIAQGHGPAWERWMRKVGLNPLRYDPNDNTTYMTPKELADKAVKDAANKARVAENNEVKESKGLQRVMPSDNLPVTVVVNGKALNGMLACRTPNQKGREVWAFVDEEYMNTPGYRGGHAGWQNMWANQIYRYAGTNKELHATTAWKNLIHTVRAYFTQQKLAKQVKRTMGRF